LQAVALGLCLGFPTASARWKQGALEAEKGFAMVQARARVTEIQLTHGESYTFEEYMVDFGKKYSSAAEMEKRKVIFARNLAEIVNHNNGNYTWKKHVNRFADLSKDEFREQTRGFDLRKHRRHINFIARRFNKTTTAKASNTKTCGKTLDYRTMDIMSPIKNQGMCGSCWAYSSTEALEAHLALAEQKKVVLSAQHMTSCTPNPEHCGGTGGCMGATAELAFEYVKTGPSGGITLESEYGPTSYISGQTGECNDEMIDSKQCVAALADYGTSINDEDAVVEALCNHGPVVIGVDATDWGAYSRGILMDTENWKCGWDVDHAVLLVGFGQEEVPGMDKPVKYWIIRNSWGPSWGEGGYIRIHRPDTVPSGLDVTPLDGNACEGETDPIELKGYCGMLSGSAWPLGVSSKNCESAERWA